MSERWSTLDARRRHAAAAATAAAGIIHVAATVPHLSEGVRIGAAFGVMGALQLALAARLAIGRGGRVLDLGAVGVHVAALVAWISSRTVGLPAFLHPGVEPVGLADATTVAVELAAVVLLAWRVARPAPIGRSRAASVAVVSVAWVLAVTGSAAGLGALGQNPHGQGGAGHTSEVDDDPPHTPSEAPTREVTLTDPDDGHTHAPGESH